MEKPNLKKHSAFLCAVLAVMTAAVLRQISFQSEDPLDWICAFLRSVIYIVLFAAWGVSVRGRIIQPQVRRYFTAISALMVFWVSVRTLRFLFATDPGILRYLWYLYYLPMLFIPLLAVFIAMSLGKPESFRLPKWTTLLNIPTAALLLLVLTNDLHQLVFVFPADAAVWANDYHYAIGYFLAVGWLMLCALAALVTMLLKCRIPHSRKFLLLPFIPAAAALTYGVMMFFRLPWIKIIAADMTVVFCLLFTAVLETCIQCGLIQANTHYMDLFYASTVGAQITDRAFHVVLSSGAAKSVDIKTLRQTQQAPVMLEGGIRLSGAPLKNGYVIWTEDISPLIKVLADLEEAQENLQGNNDILEEEHAVKVREAHIAEQDRLYQIIRRDTAHQILLMDQMIRQTEASETEEQRVRLLGKMLVIGVYLKRRSNLIFIGDKSPLLPAKELSLTFGESMDNLELYGVACGFHSQLTDQILTAHIMTMYDFFEAITERALDSMSAITVFVGKAEDGAPMITVNTDADTDLSDLSADAVRDADGEWQLTLRLSRQGGNACDT